MGATEFIFSVISTLTGLLNSLQSSGYTTADGEGDGVGVGVERDLGRLERLLKRIQAVLRDAGEREIRYASLKHWLREILAVAYQAEDILGEWRYELLRLQIEGLGLATSSPADGARKRKRLPGANIPDEMAERIKAVIDCFEEISRDKDALFLREEDGEPRACAPTGLLPTSHMVNESAVFGRDGDKKKILDFILLGNRGTSNHISVTAIIGMGGIGKTTLAQLVYNDPLVRCSFDKSAWVYVSPRFDVPTVAKEVLESISEKDSSGFRVLSVVQRAIVNEIEGKNLFLVLDDVWNMLPDQWDQFVAPLRVAESVRILVTTRHKAVAQIVQATYTCKLGCLPLDQCKLLFEHYAFAGQIIDDYPELREIGAQIVTKCDALPLAIKCIGRALSWNMCEESWRDVLESELWKSDVKDEIFPALKVSYYNLPPELKPCFLFCSLFPKGYRYRKDEIIYMWISHGYIQSRGSKSEECIGDELIHELDRRCFLMLDKQIWKETFTLHDLIHDLAKFISLGQFCTHTRESIDTFQSNEVHHVYTDNCSMIHGGSSGLIRTLVYKSNCRKSDLDDNLHMDMTRHYNLNLCTNTNLRVLNCHGVYAHDLEHMANLKHLRYLEINHNNLERLPKSTTLLFNLVALRISFLPNLKELPVHIGKLVNLRFLSMDTVGIEELPESLGQLSNLQMLSLCSCPQWKELPICIGNLINLKQLHISHLECTELPESLCMLRKLQTLVLEGCWKIVRLPDGIGNLINLRCMYVSDGALERLPKSINQLCNLEVLELITDDSLIGLLGRLKGLLNKCLLNISIKAKLGIESNESWKNVSLEEILIDDLSIPVSLHQDLIMCIKYRKSQSLLDCLQPLNNLIELKVNGNQGIAYPRWFGTNDYSGIAIFMQCYLNNSKFLAEFGEFPSLKSLALIGENLGDDFSQIMASPQFKVIFPSLEKIEFRDMLEWNLPIGVQEKDLPVLHSLTISNCPNLSSVPKFDLLKRLEIIKCSFSNLELDRLHWQRLESIHIEECLQLSTLLGLQSLNSLRTLYVVRCRQLEEFTYPRIQNLPLSIEIVGCPSLKSWCQRQQLNYIKNFSCKKLATSGIRNIMKQGSQEFLLEHLVIEKCIEQSLMFHKGLCNLVTLEIRSCWKLETLKVLSELKWLRRLVLWDCPLLQLEKVTNAGISHLPPFLRELVVHGCHRMLSLDLQPLQCPSLFTDLEITDCKQLMYIRGLENLTILDNLAIIQCPRLLEIGFLPIVPDCVIIISGCPRLKAWCEMHSIEQTW